MVNYCVVRDKTRTPLAVVVDDGHRTIVLGDTSKAEALRDDIELVHGRSERARVRSLVGYDWPWLDRITAFGGTLDEASTLLGSLYLD